MRSITVKLHEDIAIRMEGEAQILHRDIAELAGERLAERYSTTPLDTQLIGLTEELQPLPPLSFDTKWAGSEDTLEDETDADLLMDIRRFLGRETE